jgi:hypothetical protein
VQFSFTIVEEIYYLMLIVDRGSKEYNWAACSNDGEIIQIHKTVGFNSKYISENNLLGAVE